MKTLLFVLIFTMVGFAQSVTAPDKDAVAQNTPFRRAAFKAVTAAESFKIEDANAASDTAEFEAKTKADDLLLDMTRGVISKSLIRKLEIETQMYDLITQAGIKRLSASDEIRAKADAPFAAAAIVASKYKEFDSCVASLKDALRGRGVVNKKCERVLLPE
jgi:hypothetical protein